MTLVALVALSASAVGVAGVAQAGSAPSDTDADAVVATVPVPAPGGGTTSTTVQVEEQEVLEPVAVDETVAVEVEQGSVSAELVELARAQGRPGVAGQIAGPALSVRVRLSNDSAQVVATDTVTVTAQDAEGAPLSPVPGETAFPFAGDLGAGEAADAVYLFTLPEGSPGPFTVTVNPAAQAPVAVFVGSLR